MKKKIFFRWNNMWNIYFVVLLGILIYAFVFEREFFLSSEQSSVFLKCCSLVVGFCCLFLSRVVIADEEKVYVCNFIGMTLSVIYWKNCTKCFIGNIVESNAKLITTFKCIIIKDNNHKKVKPNSTKEDCAIIIDYSKKRKEILQKFYGKNINENSNMIYR